MNLPVIFFILTCNLQALATECTCGYHVNSANGGDAWLFTDAIETDFTRLGSITSAEEWQRQQFNVSAESGRGKYAKMFTPNNIAIGPSIANQGTSQKHVGVELSVSATIVNNAVPVAEMDTTRRDIFWGSFRAGMKLTAVRGTCAAFFWYFNDTQEIDMEFLSMGYNQDNSTYPVNLVIQTKDSAERGYDASGTPTYKTVNLKFDPTAGFHEYRFDYLPGKVFFYADSELLAEMEGPGIPDSAGHLILQHWSNGNAKWSGGPPQEDATMIVSYFKAYFNSSDPRREDNWKRECDTQHVAAACLVPNGTANDAAEGGQFLSSNHTQDNNDESLATTTTVKLYSVLMALIGLALIGIGAD